MRGGLKRCRPSASCMSSPRAPVHDAAVAPLQEHLRRHVLLRAAVGPRHLLRTARRPVLGADGGFGPSKFSGRISKLREPKSVSFVWPSTSIGTFSGFKSQYLSQEQTEDILALRYRNSNDRKGRGHEAAAIYSRAVGTHHVEFLVEVLQGHGDFADV